MLSQNPNRSVMKCGVSKEAEAMPDGSTFETKEEIISLKASSIRTSIFEWYCCCGTEDGGQGGETSTNTTPNRSQGILKEQHAHKDIFRERGKILPVQ